MTVTSITVRKITWQKKGYRGEVNREKHYRANSCREKVYREKDCREKGGRKKLTMNESAGESRLGWIQRGP